MKIRCCAVLLLLLASYLACAAQEAPKLRGVVLGDKIFIPDGIDPIPVSDRPVTGFAFNYQATLAYCTKEALWSVTLPNTNWVRTPPAPSRLLAQNEKPATGYFEGPLLWDFDAGRLAGYRVELTDKKPTSRELWIYDSLSRKLATVVPKVWVSLACWSADGQKLAYAVSKASDPAQVGLWLLDVTNQQKTRISPQPALSLNFYENSALLCYQTSEPATYAYYLATGKTEKLPGFPAGPWVASADGRYLASLKDNRLAIWNVNTASSVYTGPAAAMGDWLPYNSDIIAFLGPDQKPQIMALTGGKRTLPWGVAKMPAATHPTPPLQWSGKVLPLAEERGQLIWLAFIVKNKLSVLRVWYENLSPADKVALGGGSEAEMEVLLSNMKQVALAALMFTQDNDMVLPSADHFLDELRDYVKNTQVFERPGYPGKPVVKIAYQGDGVPLALIGDPAATVLFKIDLGEYTIFGFADGHARTYSRQQAQDAVSDPNNTFGPNGAMREKYAP